MYTGRSLCLYSFQSPTDLFFVIDYKSGGELFSHLQKDGGRFEEGKVRFYLCEIVLAIQYLHNAGIIYRFVVESSKVPQWR